MRVFSVRFTNADQDEVEVSSDLGDFYLPWPCRSWHRQAILSWMDQGNKIRPYRKDDDPELLRSAMIREVYAQAARLLDSATARYAIAEQIIWPELEREARQFLLDGTTGALMNLCLGEDGARSSEELAYAVIHSANRLHQFRGAVIACRARHLKALRAGDLEALEAYDVNRGWPDLPAD
jgi:hypothetical protein